MFVCDVMEAMTSEINSSRGADGSFGVSNPSAVKQHEEILDDSQDGWSQSQSQIHGHAELVRLPRPVL